MARCATCPTTRVIAMATLEARAMPSTSPMIAPTMTRHARAERTSLGEGMCAGGDPAGAPGSRDGGRLAGRGIGGSVVVVVIVIIIVVIIIATASVARRRAVAVRRRPLALHARPVTFPSHLALTL